MRKDAGNAAKTGIALAYHQPIGHYIFISESGLYIEPENLLAVLRHEVFHSMLSTMSSQTRYKLLNVGTAHLSNLLRRLTLSNSLREALNVRKELQFSIIEKEAGTLYDLLPWELVRRSDSNLDAYEAFGASFGCADNNQLGLIATFLLENKKKSPEFFDRMLQCLSLLDSAEALASMAEHAELCDVLLAELSSQPDAYEQATDILFGEETERGSENQEPIAQRITGTEQGASPDATTSATISEEPVESREGEVTAELLQPSAFRARAKKYHVKADKEDDTNRILDALDQLSDYAKKLIVERNVQFYNVNAGSSAALMNKLLTQLKADRPDITSSELQKLENDLRNLPDTIVGVRLSPTTVIALRAINNSIEPLAFTIGHELGHIATDVNEAGIPAGDSGREGWTHRLWFGLFVHWSGKEI